MEDMKVERVYEKRWRGLNRDGRRYERVYVKAYL